jgi:hypothetical protein
LRHVGYCVRGNCRPRLSPRYYGSPAACSFVVLRPAIDCAPSRPGCPVDRSELPGGFIATADYTYQQRRELWRFKPTI